MSNTFPCVDFDIDANKFRVDTGHAFVGGFDTEEEAQMHCVRIVIDKDKHNREKLIKTVAKVLNDLKGQTTEVDIVAELIVSNTILDGWRKP